MRATRSDADPRHTSPPGPSPTGGTDARASGAPANSAAPRLNLLLTYAGWRDESWADALPRLLEPMGVTALRARSAREARDVLSATRVHIAVVDLGLPLETPPPAPEPAPSESSDAEEAGPRLLELLRRLEAPPPTVVVKRARSHRDDRREIASALRAGAFAVVDRPSAARDLELMLEVLRRCMIRHYRGLWPGT